MNTALDLPDACPSCQPGIPDASLPVGPVTEISGVRVADYQCGSCRTAWTASFNRAGFMTGQSVAVAPEQRRAA